MGNVWVYQAQILGNEMGSILPPVDGAVWGTFGVIVPIIMCVTNSNIDLIILIVMTMQSILLFYFIKNFPSESTK